MRRDLWPMVPYRSAYRCRLLFGLLSALAMPGCSHKGEVSFTSATKPTTVQVINPTVRNIVRVVGQPSFIESYERTSIYPKPTAYIQKWIVDIGDKVKKGDVLATLFAPELIEEDGTKQAAVVLDQQRIALAKVVVEVAKADVAAALARVKEAEEILAKYQAEVERWDTEVKRLQREAERGVVDPRVLLESTYQLKSSTAARDKATATVKRAKAELLSAQATLAKAEVDVRVAEADLKVAESEQRYAKAWVDYLTLTAPFDSVITGRNANTYDFVLPTTGDPTAFYLAPDISPGGGAAPIYVVDRTDIVRIFVDIPEQDANYVHIGSKATVLAKAYRD
ncbi:MAG: HlyD family secretion protein, partial [Isosphaeraceae bacterium]